MYNDFYGDLEMINKISKDPDWFNNINIEAGKKGLFDFSSGMVKKSILTVNEQNKINQMKKNYEYALMLMDTHSLTMFPYALKFYPDKEAELRSAAEDAIRNHISSDRGEVFMNHPEVRYSLQKYFPSILKDYLSNQNEGLEDQQFQKDLADIDEDAWPHYNLEPMINKYSYDPNKVRMIKEKFFPSIIKLLNKSPNWASFFENDYANMPDYLSQLQPYIEKHNKKNNPA